MGLRPHCYSATNRDPPRGASWFVWLAVVVAVGVAAGLAGMLLAMVLHVVQHFAYGYGQDPKGPVIAFLQGASEASPLRRALAVAVCGLVAGGGWWGLQRFGRPLVSVPKAIETEGPPLPAGETLIDALLQIVTVALGSPVGREAAPRQAAAVFAGWIARGARLSRDDCRRLVACAAGAGLAAVYNVPLGGALYSLEVLLKSFSVDNVILAVATSTIAARVAWIGLGNDVQYAIVAPAAGPSLIVWSIVTGPLFGVAAYVFARTVGVARAQAPRGARLLPWCFGAFVAIGLAAAYFPQILGNGRGPAHLGFDNRITPLLAVVVFALRFGATTMAFRAGARGGMLTPSVALGALMATALGALWSLAWPGAALGGFALVGAAAFLASSQAMPMTAVALIIEFTRIGHDVFFPILFAVSGSAAAGKACQRWEESRRSARRPADET